jgi:DNA replication protein DnaC
LRLSGILHTLDARMREAVAGQWSYQEFLERLLQDEIERRAQQQLTRRVRRAQVNSSKTLDTFDFHVHPSLNRQQVLHLASGDYIRQHRNVLICGPTGVGKSHLAHSLAHAACQQGYDVLLRDTHTLLRHLNAGRADASWEQRLQTYLRPDVLVLDDFGLKPLAAALASDLYDLINERYERGSIVLTSNRAPNEWPSLFGDPLLAAAGLDRLGDRAEVLVITGRSYRARGRQALEHVGMGASDAPAPMTGPLDQPEGADGTR